MAFRSLYLRPSTCTYIDQDKYQYHQDYTSHSKDCPLSESHAYCLVDPKDIEKDNSTITICSIDFWGVLIHIHILYYYIHLSNERESFQTVWWWMDSASVETHSLWYNRDPAQTTSASLVHQPMTSFHTTVVNTHMLNNITKDILLSFVLFWTHT